MDDLLPAHAPDADDLESAPALALSAPEAGELRRALHVEGAEVYLDDVHLATLHEDAPFGRAVAELHFTARRASAASVDALLTKVARAYARHLRAGALTRALDTR